MIRFAPLLAALLLSACASAQPMADDRAHWNAPFAPFTVFANVHYVGPAGVSSFLITTPEGHILLDGGLPESAPVIEANIKALGYDIDDVRILLNTHAHFDHAGGLAALKAASGAALYVSQADRAAVESGHVLIGPSAGIDFPPAHVDRVIADGETIRLGGATLTAHLTPGHTPGCTSYSMTATNAAGAAHSIFFHCSSSVAGQSLAPEAYPGVVADYRAAFAKVAAMQADIFLANHGSFFDLEAKRARQLSGDADAFVDPGELQRFNTLMQQRFEADLARESAVR